MADFEFIAPPWLDGQDAETIHRRMMAELPDDIDDTEGGFPWDFTKPAALEKAELLEFEMLEAVKSQHYMFAYGVYLDYHAEEYGIHRRGAVAAAGELQITGSPGTIIPNGFQFAVPANGNQAAIIYAATDTVTLNYDGEAEITVQAIDPGPIGNVAADTIVIMVQPINGITSITNTEAFTGGAAEEDDGSLRERIRDYLIHGDVSYAGCDADYKRWAMEVDGVGNAKVIPEWAGAGTVKVVCFDMNGDPANSVLVENVYNHIVSPSDRDKRLAPIGATVTVVAPSAKTINIACTLTLSTGAVSATVINNIKSAIQTYFKSGISSVKRNMIGSIIMAQDGVNDYSSLTLNSESNNISISTDEYPVLGTFYTEE